MLLCATDFSFVELVNLAESCIQRFGFSVMGDIINAGVDPHRWFAGVRKRIIDSKTDFTKDPKAVEEINAFLAENISKKERQDSKAAKLKLALQGVIPVEEESELLEGTWPAAV